MRCCPDPRVDAEQLPSIVAPSCCRRCRSAGRGAAAMATAATLDVARGDAEKGEEDELGWEPRNRRCDFCCRCCRRRCCRRTAAEGVRCCEDEAWRRALSDVVGDVAAVAAASHSHSSDRRGGARGGRRSAMALHCPLGCVACCCRAGSARCAPVNVSPCPCQGGSSISLGVGGVRGG